MSRQVPDVKAYDQLRIHHMTSYIVLDFISIVTGSIYVTGPAKIDHVSTKIADF